MLPFRTLHEIQDNGVPSCPGLETGRLESPRGIPAGVDPSEPYTIEDTHVQRKRLRRTMTGTPLSGDTSGMPRVYRRTLIP